MPRKEKLDDVTPEALVFKCPNCGQQHVDMGQCDDVENNRHRCEVCGYVWMQMDAPHIGVPAGADV